MEVRCVYVIDGKKHYGDWLDADCITTGYCIRNMQFMNMVDNWYLEYKGI